MPTKSFFNEQQDIKFFSKNELNLIFSYKFKKNNHRNKLIIGLGLYAGMRVSEIIQLKVSDVNMKDKKFKAIVLKKKKPESREVIINDLLMELFLKYFEIYDYRNNEYMFPGQIQSGKNGKNDPQPYITRQAVSKFFNQVQKDVGLVPKSIHKLRHSCAVHMLDDGASIDDVSLFFKHSDSKITRVYADLTNDKQKELSHRLMKFDSWFKRLKRRISVFHRIDRKEIITSKPKNFNVTNIKSIGRKKEIDQLKHYFERKINILITGIGGVGKSHLLEAISGDNIIRLQEVKPVKIKLFELTKLLRDNEIVGERFKQLYPDLVFDEETGKDGLKVSHFQRRSIKENCSFINSLVYEKEFYLIIDSVQKMDVNLVETFNELRLKFTILTTAREIKVINDEAFNNFQKIELRNLDKNSTYVLSMLISKQRNLQIMNETMFYNQIFLQTAGNPRAILELIQRYELENDLGVVDDQMLLNIRQSGALKEIDISPVFLVFTAFLAVFRYIRSDGFLDFRLVGAVGLALFFLIKTWLNYTKRK